MASFVRCAAERVPERAAPETAAGPVAYGAVAQTACLAARIGATRFSSGVALSRCGQATEGLGSASVDCVPCRCAALLDCDPSSADPARMTPATAEVFRVVWTRAPGTHGHRARVRDPSGNTPLPGRLAVRAPLLGAIFKLPGFLALDDEKRA
ncbi:hypothetical protein DL766_005100 [Monosporascus sp. MC13-8B]|uniref:Uncharacterized protein n=1 Tax=Monosporascus cannonballus TaxID=155416 RepID=A0ABY0GV97_9PEZI|nr:hypothetical protein DL762_008872 [Monosporascus cannonballus]RYO97253.1 hypothetical protein DL763_002802 [Monosporascus cannonballus]RYP29954.1 hypothetical protein DL766_005100 [Monosporascus sp. MC13-8B]